jgi:hypothetical protein
MGNRGALIARWALIIIAFAIPFAVRVGLHYRGIYTPSPVPESTMVVPPPATPVLQHAEERPEFMQGTVVFDLAHENQYDSAELSVLLARLTARGQVVEFLRNSEESGEDLNSRLRYASSLVVICPAQPFTNGDARAIRHFVDKGGRLLLIADPTRFQWKTDEMGYIIGVQSLVPAINSLAADFDIVFADDYLYNMQQNESNYRNVILRDFARDPLTAGLKEVAFYATHSLRTQGAHLILADENTVSSRSETRTKLAVMVRSSDDNVVAIGDMTFLTEPYNAVMDNDQLVSHLADFLAGARRTYELADFPYFFSSPVDVIQTKSVLLDGRVIAEGGPLQKAFRKADLVLRLRDQEDPSHDTLYLGSFDDADLVKDYLDNAGIKLIFVRPITATPQSAEGTPTPTFTPTPTPTPSATAEGRKPPSEVDRIAIKGIGEIGMAGTTLFLMTKGEGDRRVLIAMAEDIETLTNSLNFLVTGDLSTCLSSERVTLCHTGKGLPEKTPTPQFAPEETPTVEETTTPGEETPMPEETTTPAGSLKP